MRSLNGGWHGLAGWGCFRRFPETGLGLWADDGANPVSVAGSSLAATELCLAELRSVPEIPGAERLPGVLAGTARWTAVFGHGGAFQADQAGRTARRGRRVQAALSARSVGWASEACPPFPMTAPVVGTAQARLCPPCEFIFCASLRHQRSEGTKNGQ